MILETLFRKADHTPTPTEIDSDLLRLKDREVQQLATLLLEVTKPNGTTWDQLSPAEQQRLEQVFGPRTETGLPVEVTNFSRGDTADTNAYPLTLGNETTEIVVNGPLLMVHVTPHPESGLPPRNRVLVPQPTVVLRTRQLLLPSELYTAEDTLEESLLLSILRNPGTRYQPGAILMETPLGKQILRQLRIQKINQNYREQGFRESLRFMREWERQINNTVLLLQNRNASA